MRDLSTFRNRLLAAMGLLQTAACATPAATPPVVVVTADSTADGAMMDAAPADAPATVQDAEVVASPTVADTVKADAPADAAAETAAEVAPEVATPDVATDVVADTGPPVCKFGKPEQVCYTAAALKATIDSPPMGGDANPDAYSGVLPPEGCPSHGLVKDGCCNPAEGSGILQGDKCCYWFCTGACCGRPLVVAGQARIAPQVEASAWSAGGVASAAELAPDERTALAAAWRADAADEHASVASFLRFGLDLLQFGAPPALVAAAATAAADEVRHAQVCCAMAEGLDGRTTGPGALDCAQVVAHGDLAQAAAAAVVEGCVGETLASVCLGVAARGTGDAGLRATLQALADDEARHAELAWQFVRWAVAQPGDGRVREAVAQAFARALAGSEVREPRAALLAEVSLEALRAGGRLDPAAFAAACRGALEQVVGPCARAVLAIT